MTEHNDASARSRDGDGSQVFWWSSAVALLFLLGVLFLPWDAPMPKAPDLKFTPAALSAPDNAFTYFEEAARLKAAAPKFKMANGNPWNYEISGKIGSPQEAWDPKLAQEILEAHAAVFAELEKGLDCPGYASPQVTDVTMRFPWLQDDKAFAQLMGLQIKTLHLSGDYPGAARVALKDLRLGEFLCNRNDSMIEWLVGMACYCIVGQHVEDLVDDVKTPEPVLRELLKGLNTWNPQAFTEGYRRSVKNEYGTACRSVDIDIKKMWGGIYSPGYYPKVEAKLIHVPYAWKPKASLQRLVLFYRRLIAEADKPLAKIDLSYPGQLQAPATEAGKILFYFRPNSLGLLSIIAMQESQPKCLQKKCQMQAYVDALRLRIALRLYEIKHGELPDSLQALLPEYLPAIPIDPYDGQPFRYSKTDKKVWAIGSDLTDQGGLTGPGNFTMIDRPGFDLVMPLGTRETFLERAGVEDNGKDR